VVLDREGKDTILARVKARLHGDPRGEVYVALIPRAGDTRPALFLGRQYNLVAVVPRDTAIDLVKRSAVTASWQEGYNIDHQTAVGYAAGEKLAAFWLDGEGAGPAAFDVAEHFGIAPGGPLPWTPGSAMEAVWNEVTAREEV
jgi:hypothetical protein